MKIRFGVGLSRLVGIAVAAALAASCGGGGGDPWTDESGLLRYVPADSPYVIAQGDLPPDELMDKLGPWAEQVVGAYIDMFRSMGTAPDGAALTGADAAMIEEWLTLAGELMTVDGLSEAGITRESKTLLYGSGLLPVMRVTLSDGAKLEAAVARIETTAGEPAAVATSGGHSYRYWGDEMARLVMAIVDDELVLTMAPTEHIDAHLGIVLNELPDENIAASGKLEEIASRYEFGPHYVGFLDVQQIAATFTEGPTAGIDAELLALMQYDPASLSASCRVEIDEMAAVMPRWVAGYTAFDASEMTMNMVVELRQDIAAGLQTITAPVPGLGTLRADLMSLGFGIDVPAALAFIESRLDAIEADPYQCEYFADIQSGIPAVRQGLSQPMPPEIYALKGVFIALDAVRGLDLLASGQMPSEVSARVLVASDNAPGLVAMGSMFSPEVASLQTDGTPVRINLPIPLPMPLELWAALTPSAVAMAVGPNGEARLRELVAAPASDARPFMSWDMDMRAYYQLFGEIMDVASTFDPTMLPQQTVAMSQMMGQLANGPFEREFYDVRFTTNGVEMPTTITLSD
jgi:hypothetical protein